MTEKSIGEKCDCGADRWEISATLIGCKACGKVWGRVNGQWVEETERQFNILGAKVQDSAPRLTPEGDLVVDRKIQLAKPVDYIPLKFVVPEENPLTKDEDFFIPGKAPEGGLKELMDDGDVKYFRKKLFDALNKDKEKP